VFDDELDRLINELGLDSLKEARIFADMDRTLIRFYIPGEYTWAEIRKSSQELGQRLTDAKIAAEQDRKMALQALFNSLLQALMTGRLRV
jgi:hypothetical protein